MGGRSSNFGTRDFLCVPEELGPATNLWLRVRGLIRVWGLECRDAFVW